MTKKPDFEEYLGEYAKAVGAEGDVAKAAKNFEFNMRAAHQSASNGNQLSLIIDALRAAKGDYVVDRPDLLFYPPDAVDKLSLLMKPFQSAVHKLFRHDVVFNRNYPKPPRDGFYDLANVYQNIDDLLRTRLICKYMDGPKFVCDRLRACCEANGIEYNYRDLGTEAGYYAWHFYARLPVEIMLNGNVGTHLMSVEIQISTQLAEVITTLTHTLYEERREGSVGVDDRGWRWDAGSQRFRSAYLGHGLHLLEGMIQTLKDDVFSKRTKEVVGSENEAQGAASLQATMMSGGENNEN